MRYELCTLFDRRYLARGLALYRSLAEQCRDLRLHVFCMDGETADFLDRLRLPGVVLTTLEEVETRDPALLEVKPGRSRVEYFWTLSPVICLQALERAPDADLIVRVDADLAFFADPATALAELGDGSVLLTPHRPAPEFAGVAVRETGGRGDVFNVQFEAFRRDEAGIAALRWWRERCLEWCFDRWEPDRYGDQKYLDRLPLLFDGVRTVSHPGAGLAPWNVGAHRLERNRGRLLVDGSPLVFHHYQSLEVHAATAMARTLARRTSAYRLTDGPVPFVWTTGWRLTERQLDLLWEPYVRRLSEATAEMQHQLGEDADPPPVRARRAAFHVARRRLPQRLRDAYWRRWELARRRQRDSTHSESQAASELRAASATDSTSESDSSG